MCNALSKNGRGEIKTLADEFIYPRFGAGQVYATMADKIKRQGGNVVTGACVCNLRRHGNHVVAALVESEHGPYEVQGRFFLTSNPLTQLIEMMQPEAPPEVLRAARALRYREHIGVNLLIEGHAIPGQLDLCAQPRGGGRPHRQLPQLFPCYGWQRRH